MGGNAGIDGKFTLWLTGLSGSGKTTIAQNLLRELEDRGYQCELIDGDAVRKFFGNDTDYTRSGRNENVKRIIFAAKLLSRNGVITIVANIAPYEEIRELARKEIDNYIQVYVKASIETCIRRDPKGIYAKALVGEESHVVGLDDQYEEPKNPEVTVDTEDQSVSCSVKAIMNYLDQHNLLPIVS